MREKVIEKIEEHFCRVKDPRIQQSKEHKVLDILSIATCASFPRLTQSSLINPTVITALKATRNV
jgi:hypothetical protein